MTISDLIFKIAKLLYGNDRGFMRAFTSKDFFGAFVSKNEDKLFIICESNYGSHYVPALSPNLKGIVHSPFILKQLGKNII